jgi:hypothetical protein
MRESKFIIERRDKHETIWKGKKAGEHIPRNIF